MNTATHTISLGSDTRFADATNYNAIIEEMIAKNGGKFDGLEIKPIAAEAVAAVLAPTIITALPLAAPATPAFVRGSTVDAVGAARALDDTILAKLNGFAPQQPLFTRGTKVFDLGVDNARQSRVEHNEKPLVEEACVQFIQRIAAEKRADEVVPFDRLRMNAKGELVNACEVVPGQGPMIATDGKLGPMTNRGFASLLSRSGIGGHQYLSAIPAKLRAINVNHHFSGRDGCPIPEGDVKIRTRRTHGGREIFAVVSPKYTSYDAHMVAGELITAVEGTQARGSVLYDGERARFEALWHSDVQPEDYVAGEFFKAGIIITTADDGSGSCRVSACVWQNLCLNLIIIDEAEQEIERIRHIGAVETMAARLRAALVAAEEKVAGFVKKWGYACRDILDQPGDMSVNAIIPGYFNGVIERELVPVRGKRQDVVRSLVQMYEKDESSATRKGFTRAALANAFTRWAHEVNTDPWLQDDVQRAAGLLVQSTDPLPFETIEIKG